MIDIVKNLEELNTLVIKNGGVIPFSYHNGEFYFLFGREARDSRTDDRSLWGDFGGKIKNEKENNLEGIVREFWEGSNGLFGTYEGIKNYIVSNIEKLLVINSTEYEGIVIFLPMEYDKKYERIFHTGNVLYKHVLDTKKEIQKARSRGLLEKDLIQWYTISEILKLKKKFRKCNSEIIDFMKDTFN